MFFQQNFIFSSFPGATIESFYIAYLLKKDKSYWIEYDVGPDVSIRDGIKQILKKPITYFILGVVLIIVIPNVFEKYKFPPLLKRLMQFFLIGVLIIESVIIVIWIIKIIKK